MILLVLMAMSASWVSWLFWLGLPVFATLFVLQKGGDAYLRDEGAAIGRILHWLASAYAYLGLLTDELPTRKPSPAVRFELVTDLAPTARLALLRIITSIPALLLLVLLWILASILWIVGAVVVLVRERAPAAVQDFLELTVRFQLRVIAYHLSLVDTYPHLREREERERVAV